MSGLTRFLFAIVIALASFSSAFVLGFNAGGKSATTKHQAEQAEAAQKARDKYDVKQRQGEAAATAYLEADRARATQFQTLTEKFHVLRRTTPLVTPRSGLFACHGTGLIRPLPDAASPPDQPQPQPPEGAAPALPQGADDSGIALTAGAVWLWNSALTGTDQPTHSCGAADPTAPACAAGTSLTLNAAWDNHIANAQACAANRLAHQHLIDFIRRQQAPQTPPTQAAPQ